MAISTIEHKIEVYDINDNLVAVLDNAANKTYERALNRSTTFRFTIPLRDPKANQDILKGGQNYIKYYRGTQLQWAGQIVNIQRSLAGEEIASVLCADWFFLLKHRRTNPERIFTAVNEGTILQTLVNESQALPNGDYGIIIGSNTSTSPRDRTYNSKILSEAFMEMSEVIDGLDFEITPDKTLNIYENKGTDRRDTHVFEYGLNISEVNFIEDYTDIVNDSYGIGKDDLTATFADTSLQPTYYLREAVENFGDISSAATLTGHLQNTVYNKALGEKKYELSVMPAASPQFGTYEIGDSVTIKIDHPNFTVDTVARIISWSVTINNDGGETIALKVSTTR